jgi:PUA domain protein
MFRHFSVDDLGQATTCKSSAIRGMKQAIVDLYPAIEPFIDDILPKKENIEEVKGKDKASSFIVVNSSGDDDDESTAKSRRPLFFRQRDGPYFPTLRLLHQYPNMMTRVQVDAGGIKFILKGADVMCPGMTSSGGVLPPGLPAGCPVAIYAQGKEHAMAVGVLKMSTEDIKKLNKGAGVETMHHIGDELWPHVSF